MNEFSLVYFWIISQFQSDNLVNTITFAPTMEIDFNKENIYPLVNIDFKQSRVDEFSVNINFQITVLQQRDVMPAMTNDKLKLDTNQIDNLNETHSICERFINVARRANNDEEIEMITVTPLTPLHNFGLNGLDGFRFEIELGIKNKGSIC